MLTQKKRPLILRVISRLLAIAMFVVVAVIFYLVVVLGQPQETQQEAVDLHQPLTAPAQTQNITSVVQLNDLMAAFPVEVLCAPASSGYVLENGSAYDVEFAGGVARVIRLQYVTPDGFMLALDSIYPARAVDVLKYGDYRLQPSEGSPVAGMRTVRMENDETVRLHAQSAHGLYAVTAPLNAAGQLPLLVQPLQMMNAQ